MKWFLVCFILNTNIAVAVAQSSSQPIDHETNVKEVIKKVLILVTRKDAIALTGYLPEDTIYTTPHTEVARFWLRKDKHYFATIEDEYAIETRRNMRTILQSIFNTIPSDFLSIHFTLHSLSFSSDSTRAEADYSIYFRDATTNEPNKWNTFPPIHMPLTAQYINNVWTVTNLFDIVAPLAAPLIGPLPIISPPKQLRELPDLTLFWNRVTSESITIDLEGESPLFTDPEGDALTYRVGNSNSCLQVTIDGSLLTLTTKKLGFSMVLIIADDDHDGKAVAFFGVDVNGFALFAAQDSLQAKQSEPSTLLVTQNDRIATFLNAKITSVTQSENSDTIKINSDNTIYYKPKNNFTGTDKFVYTLSNQKGITSSAEVTITINTQPVAHPDTIVVEPNGRINIDVLQNDKDNEGDTFTLTSVTQAKHSERVVINSNGTIHYRPTLGYEGVDEFTYRITDSLGNQAQSFVFIYVLPKKRSPDFNRDGKVDFSDFTLFATAFGSINRIYDLSGDGQVSFPDLIIFGSAFGK